MWDTDLKYKKKERTLPVNGKDVNSDKEKVDNRKRHGYTIFICCKDQQNNNAEDALEIFEDCGNYIAME